MFFDDAWPATQTNGCWSIVGNTDTLLERFAEFDGIVVSIGNCVTRLAKHQLLRQAGAKMVTVVHPKTVLGRGVKLGVGSVLMAGAIVNVDSFIGEACIINTGATVDHDVGLGDGVHICPGVHVAGNVHIGACSWIGIGAVVRQSLAIGSNVTVGAGAVVVNPLADGMTVVGNPAKPTNY